MRLLIISIITIFAGKEFANAHKNWKIVLRQFFIQKVLRINGKVNWMVHPTSQIKASENIIRGNRNPGLSPGCYLDGRNGIYIGNNTWIGPHVCLISMNHDTNNFHQYIQTKSIKIGNNCWLGAKSVVLPGVEIGNHVIVAAGAVVTKSFLEEDIVLAGIPARIVKKLSPYNDSKELK